jgi:hypothetical protein
MESDYSDLFTTAFPIATKGYLPVINGNSIHSSTDILFQIPRWPHFGFGFA